MIIMCIFVFQLLSVKSSSRQMRSHHLLDPFDNQIAGYYPYIEAAIKAPNFQSKIESIFRILLRTMLGQDSRLGQSIWGPAFWTCPC